MHPPTAARAPVPRPPARPTPRPHHSPSRRARATRRLPWTLVAAQRLATLSTLRPGGHPFGSVVQYIDDGGAPVIFVSELAEHTKHLRADGRASVLVTSPVAVDDDPMALPRLCLVGRFATISPEPVLRERFFARHPTAQTYAAFADFAFWRLDVEAVRFVGGYGRMSWVAPDGYVAAGPDPLAADIEGIVNHMNDDHADACLAYVQALGGLPAATSARLLSVDRLGMDLLASTPDGLATTQRELPGAGRGRRRGAHRRGRHAAGHPCGEPAEAPGSSAADFGSARPSVSRRRTRFHAEGFVAALPGSASSWGWRERLRLVRMLVETGPRCSTPHETCCSSEVLTHAWTRSPGGPAWASPRCTGGSPNGGT